MNKMANEILCNFINTIGLDGDYYKSTLDCDVVYGRPKFNADGEYIEPESKRLVREYKEYDRGLIVINKKYYNSTDSNAIVTLIHEKLHSNRCLLVDGAYKDAYQEIAYGKYIDEDEKLSMQTEIDEALIELISVLSYVMYSNKKDIWKNIYSLGAKYDDNNIRIMCKIIEKHHDFELFKWILDPISYQYGDTSYDFFSDYTKNDKELTSKLCLYEYDIDSIISKKA